MILNVFYVKFLQFVSLQTVDSEFMSLGRYCQCKLQCIQIESEYFPRFRFQDNNPRAIKLNPLINLYRLPPI